MPVLMVQVPLVQFTDSLNPWLSMSQRLWPKCTIALVDVRELESVVTYIQSDTRVSSCLSS